MSFLTRARGRNFNVCSTATQERPITISGMYRLTVDNVEHYLVVMRHVFSQKLKIHTKYKLKGSTVDREASQKERAKDTPTYKDNDFLQDGIKIAIGPEAKKTVLETLNADVGFLSKIHNMGYSLILGVHNIGMYVLYVSFMMM